MKSGIAILIVFVATINSAGGAMFFLSDDPNASTAGNVNITLGNIGDSATLYLFADLAATDTISALGINILAEPNGVLSSVSNTIANPLINLGFGGAKPRWQGANPGTMDSLVTGMRAIGINMGPDPAWGLHGGLADTDPTYNGSFFLVSTLEIFAEQAGSADLFIETNDLVINFSGPSGPMMNFGVGDAAIDPRTEGVYSALADGTITVIGDGMAVQDGPKVHTTPGDWWPTDFPDSDDQATENPDSDDPANDDPDLDDPVVDSPDDDSSSIDPIGSIIGDCYHTEIVYEIDFLVGERLYKESRLFGADSIVGLWDQAVTNDDLIITGGGYRTVTSSLGSPAVPEPASAMLMLAGLGWLLRRRIREN